MAIRGMAPIFREFKNWWGKKMVGKKRQQALQQRISKTEKKIIWEMNLSHNI